MSALFAGVVRAEDVDVLTEERARALERLVAERARMEAEAASVGGNPELAALRKQIAEANERLAIENRVLNQRQRKLELSDPIAKGLREDVLARQKELIELRRSLQSRLDAIPEIRELKRQRSELVEQVKALREQERSILLSERSESAAEQSSFTIGK